MKYYAGLDVGGKKTAVCVVEETGRIVWQGMVDTHPEMLGDCLKRWRGKLVHVGLESGAFTPHLHRSLAGQDFPMVCMDARRTADAIKSRRIKTDKGDAQALAEMLRTGWFTDVHVKTADTHRLKALLGARDQLVRIKRSLGNQVRGLLRPFGIKLPSRVGTKLYAQAAHQATQNDAILHASITALLEALVSIDAQTAKLDAQLKELARRNDVAWRLMSIPGVGPLTAMAFIAAIEDVSRFSSMRDIGAYLGLTPKRYQSGDTDVRLGISKQGDDMARHCLYEAANSMLSTVKKRFGLRSWGLKLMQTNGPKKARVAVARKLAVIMGRMWKDGTHFEVTAGTILPRTLPAA